MYTDLTDFINRTEVSRTGGVATVIIDHVPEGPIRLIGFSVGNLYSDFEVKEFGYNHYLQIKNFITDKQDGDLH